MRHALAALWMFLLAASAVASTTTSAITGRVTISDAPASGVTVTATSAALMRPRTTVTSARGTYWLGELPPGLYDVTFSHPGTTTLTRRAKVELARVAHADAKLEPNADEESVTSTATTMNVADTTAITSHFDDAMLDRFPLGRMHTPTVAPGDQPLGFLDDIPQLFALDVGEDPIEQTTVIRGAAGIEDDTSDGTLIVTRTRHGGEQLALSLRDTISSGAWIEDTPFFPRRGSGIEHLVEASAGGRILPERLWFFGAGWSGDDAFFDVRNVHGFEARLDGQATSSANFTAVYIDKHLAPVESVDVHNSAASVGFTGVLDPRFTTTASFSRTKFDYGDDLPLLRFSTDRIAGRASYALPATSGDHVITAGITAWDGEQGDAKAVYLSDRWSMSKWTLNAGARYDDGLTDDTIAPRVALTYDLHGDGARAISASYGEYAELFQPTRGQRIATLGFASLIGNSGSARIDVLHRDSAFVEANEVQLETRYRLFDRFEAGATYAYRDHPGGGTIAIDTARSEGNAWIGAELPIGEQEIGVTILQRYSDDIRRELPTDIALRYSLPFLRGLVFAVDATNIGAEGDIARTFRAWIRVRA